CHRLAGGNAVHAGSMLTDKRRVFGTILTRSWQDNPITWDPLDQQLAQCGEKSAVKLEYTFNAPWRFAPNMSADQAENAVLQMKQGGVTSVFFIGDPNELGQLMRAATSQAYYPEWLISSYIDPDNNPLVHGEMGQPEQQAHLFGISFQPRAVTGNSMPAQWAALEVDPSYKMSGDRLAFAAKQYWAILMIASGIQMAGPHLTAQTFESGLRRTVFPNPITSIMAG